MNNEQLNAVVTALETKAGASTAANAGREGYWKRIALAAEAIAGVSTSANEGLEGYQLRTALALEATAGTTGAEENMASAGFIKRIVDALEVKAGAVGTSDIHNRLVLAAENAVFAVFDPAALFAGATGAFYDPSDLSTLWQDSARTVPAAVDQPVGAMDDKSGNGNHALQTTAASRPTLRLASGKYYLELDGVDDWLRALFTITQTWDRISALQQVTWANTERLFSGGSVAASGVLYQRTTTPNIVINDGVDGPNGSPALGTNFVATERHAGASSRLAINSGAYVTATSGANTSPGGITIGASETGTAPAHMRLYGKVMIGRALSDIEIANTRSFFASKAGVTL